MSELSMSMFVSKDELHEARIAEAVAAERARAAQAVREIVAKYEEAGDKAAKRGAGEIAVRHAMRALVARECLAAMEAQR